MHLGGALEAPRALQCYRHMTPGLCVWAQAVTHYSDPKKLAEVSTGLGEAMVGIDCRASNFYSYAARSE